MPSEAVVKQVAAGLGIVSALAVWLVSDDVSLVFSLALGAYTFAPWAFLAWAGRSLSEHSRSVVVLACAVVAAVAYLSLVLGDGSTGALLVLFAPVYQWGAIGLAMALAQRRRQASG